MKVVHKLNWRKNIIIEPNSPSEGNIVAFIEENGAPIEFIQTRKLKTFEKETTVNNTGHTVKSQQNHAQAKKPTSGWNSG